jgi:hypothetical protein
VNLDAVRPEVGTAKSGEGRTFMLTQSVRTLLKKQLASIEALKNAGTICPMKMVGHATDAIYRRYAIEDEAMLREASAKLEAWTKRTEA